MGTGAAQAVTGADAAASGPVTSGQSAVFVPTVAGGVSSPVEDQVTTMGVVCGVNTTSSIGKPASAAGRRSVSWGSRQSTSEHVTFTE